MAVYDEAQHLLSTADKDFRALQGMADNQVFADEIFGFHAQQAVEKALKAWLIIYDIDYPKTHDISLLLSILGTHDQSAEVYEDLIEFNPYAVQFRYEAFDEIGESLDREAVCFRIGEFLKKIKALIEPMR